MIQVEVLKKLKVVFCSFLLIVHTSVLGVKYFPCNCGSFKACNPAPSHYHGNLDWKLDVKKKSLEVSQKPLFSYQLPFMRLFFYFGRFSAETLRQTWVSSWLFSRLRFLRLIFSPCRNTERGGETVWLLKGMWEACCPPLRLSLLWDPCFKMRSFDFFTEWLAICSHLIYFRDIRDWKRVTTTQKFKWGGVGGDWGGGVWWAKSVNKSDHNSSTLTDLVSAGPVGGFSPCLFKLFHFFDRFVSTANFWRHGRAPWRASGRAADRARPRGLADGAGGPLHGGDEPQRGQTAFISPHEDEKAAGLLLQTAGSPGPLQTSTKTAAVLSPCRLTEPTLHYTLTLLANHSCAVTTVMQSNPKNLQSDRVGTRHVLYEQAWGGGVITLETHGADALHSDPLGFFLVYTCKTNIKNIKK